MLRNINDELYQYLRKRRWGSALVAVIALFALLLYVWAALPPGTKERLFAGGAPASQAPQESQLTEKELALRNLVIQPCRGASEPRKLYQLARELQPSPGRDAAMANIVVDAVCVGDESFALEVFAGLEGDQKDRAAKQIAAYYLKNNRHEDANRWAGRLGDPRDKEWWIRHILEASQQKG